MMSLDIEPLSYLAQDEDASEVHEGQDDSDVSGPYGLVDEYGEDEGQPEFSKIKKEKVFGTIDFSRRKSKIVCTLG